jgi:vacuolar-type H+-ATPase subunit I/STV1
MSTSNSQDKFQAIQYLDGWAVMHIVENHGKRIAWCIGNDAEQKAKEICESFNVTNQSGLTPSELLERVNELEKQREKDTRLLKSVDEQNRELLEALKGLRMAVDATNLRYKMPESMAKADEAILNKATSKQ